MENIIWILTTTLRTVNMIMTNFLYIKN